MNEKIYRMLRHPVTIPIAISIVSFGAGVTTGLLIKKRVKKIEIHDDPAQLKLNFDSSKLRIVETRTVDEVTSDAEEFLLEHERKERKERGFDIATPAEAFILEHLDGTMVLETDPDVESVETVTQSIFVSDTGDEWNYELELQTRTTTAPYVIHRDEFYAEELGYEQTTMTYYAGDDIMADQEDAPVYNYSLVVGPLLFGHGSGDPNVFHVRNDKRKEEYEIIVDDGHFSVEVMGLEMESNAQAKNLRHDKQRKFKQE